MGHASRGIGGLAFVVAAAVGCGDDPESLPSAACAPPSRVIGNRCLPPGVQDDGCPAGTLGQPDGSCRDAGVPPELCVDGFEPDGGQGCAAILPPEPCPPGRMAVPGETSCHPVMECGAGTWGDIAVESTTIYVDGSYAGGNNDGSAARPYTTIAQAVTAAPSGGQVAIAAGSYVESLVVSGKHVRLAGKCPDEVEVVATGVSGGCPPAALCISGALASATEVRGLALTGNGYGIGVSGAEDVIIEEVWLHDAVSQGLNVQDSLGATSVTLRQALVEANHEVGVLTLGAATTIESAVVRGTSPIPANPASGMGVWANVDRDNGARATLDLRGVLLEANRGSAVLVAGSDVTVHGVVVRGGLSQPSDFARGVAIEIDPPTGLRSTATVSTLVVTDTRDVGVFVAGADATLEGVVAHGTLGREGDADSGSGLVVSIPCISAGTCDATARANVTVRGALVDANHGTGLVVHGSDAVLEGVVVRGTLPDEATQELGVGIAAKADVGTLAPGNLILRGVLVEQNRQVGVFVAGASAQLDGLLVRDTLPQSSDQRFGCGILAQIVCNQEACTSEVRTTALLRGSLIENNHYIGLAVVGADATIDAVLVRGTLPRAADGAFGDGIAVTHAILSPDPVFAASAIVTSTASTGNARSGLGNWGSTVSLGQNALSCNGFDLDGEALVGATSFTFQNLGANRCGCPDPASECVAQSVGLAPPEAPAP